jgi:uncharacterized protein (TIRG00374 family)
MTRHSEDHIANTGHPLPSWPRVQKGLRIFLVLTIVGLVFVLYRSSFTASVRHLGNFRWPYLLLAMGLMVFDWIASGARIWVFASRLQPGISYRGCIRASLANIFLGGVTPSQTGGGPGQIYVLYKEGMPAFDATVVSFLGGFLGTALFLPTCGLLVTLFFHPVTVDVRLQYIVKGSIVAFGLIVLLAVIGLVDPRPLQRGAKHLVGWLPPFRRWLERRGVIDTLMDLIDRYHHMMTYFLRRAKITLLIGFVLTGLIYFNKFVIAWVVIRGLGIQAEFWEVVYAQLVLILIFYFAPSPGAAGVAEVSTAAVMKGIIPPGYEGAFVLLWRLFTLFISLAVGAVVTARTLYRRRTDAGAAVIDYGQKS